MQCSVQSRIADSELIADSRKNRNIEYIGREDKGIKLYGIELGEVRSTISGLASAARSVALIVCNGSRIAFVTPETIDIKGVAKIIESQLPEYAVPNRIVALATIPTSASNKIDCSALKKYLEAQGTNDTVSEKLETDIQQTLATM
ncbi:hypothetical protein BJX76DRAFT_360987 [Aspergillus varians]